MKRNLISIILTLTWMAGGCASKDELKIANLAEAIDAAWEAPGTAMKQPRAFLPENLSLEEGYKVQALREHYMEKERTRAGYKITGTTPDEQNLLAVSAPLTGVLMKDMLLENGAVISAASGNALVYKPALLFRVSSEAINDAVTVEAVAAALDEAYAYIDVPDRLTIDGVPPHGGAVAAINTGARWGVLGGHVPMSADADFLSRLARMTISVESESGETLSQAQNTQNPIVQILFLLEQLRARGGKLETGNYISVDTPAPHAPIPRGQTLTISFAGLTIEPLSVSARFTD
jgi:2-keto-4-pentenoate hydratase